MSSLDTYISTVGHDISKFNAYVMMLIKSLDEHGEKTHDLLANLFKGYAACLDKTFVRYIAGKEEKYEEGEPMDPKKLMHLADTKFKTLMEKETWDAPSPEEEKIIALQAKLDNLKKRIEQNKNGKQNEGPSKTKKKK